MTFRPARYSTSVQEEKGTTESKVASESHEHLSAQQLYSQPAKGLYKVSSEGPGAVKALSNLKTSGSFLHMEKLKTV